MRYATDFVSSIEISDVQTLTMPPPVILHCFGRASGILRDYPIIIHPSGEGPSSFV